MLESVNGDVAVPVGPMFANAVNAPQAPPAYGASWRCSCMLPMPDWASVLVVKVTLAEAALVMPIGGVIEPPFGAVVSASTVKLDVAELLATSQPVTVCTPGSAAPAVKL